MRSILVSCAALVACAGAAPVSESAPAPETKVFELSQDVSAPVRKSCKLKGPRLPAGDPTSGEVVVDYLVGADGSVSDVGVQGAATKAAIRALRRYIESCRYEPARKDGKPVAVRWRGQISLGEK